jgi:hypothetical protein
MAAILSCGAMLNHGPRRRGCLIEFLYPTVGTSEAARPSRAPDGLSGARLANRHSRWPLTWCESRRRSTDSI